VIEEIPLLTRRGRRAERAGEVINILLYDLPALTAFGRPLLVRRGMFCPPRLNSISAGQSRHTSFFLNRKKTVPVSAKEKTPSIRMVVTIVAFSTGVTEP